MSHLGELESPHTRYASVHENSSSFTIVKGRQDHDPWLAILRGLVANKSAKYFHVFSEAILLKPAAEFGKMLRSTVQQHAAHGRVSRLQMFRRSFKVSTRRTGSKQEVEQADFSKCDLNNMDTHSKRLAWAVLCHMLQTNSSLTHLSECNLGDSRLE
jgi:hypothetical protein